MLSLSAIHVERTLVICFFVRVVTILEDSNSTPPQSPIVPCVCYIVTTSQVLACCSLNAIFSDDPLFMSILRGLHFGNSHLDTVTPCPTCMVPPRKSPINLLSCRYSHPMYFSKHALIPKGCTNLQEAY